ncbi:hypothetical protein Tco_0342807 [Tanacetum coccineum]
MIRVLTKKFTFGNSTSVLNIWPEIRSRSDIDGPKRAGLAIKDAIDDLPQAGMLERCVVGGPGFLKFKLSKTWIAEVFSLSDLNRTLQL